MSEAVPEAAAQHTLRRTLRRILDDSLGIEGALVATTEGLLVEAEFARASCRAATDASGSSAWVRAVCSCCSAATASPWPG